MLRHPFFFLKIASSTRVLEWFITFRRTGLTTHTVWSGSLAFLPFLGYFLSLELIVPLEKRHMNYMNSANS